MIRQHQFEKVELCTSPDAGLPGGARGAGGHAEQYSSVWTPHVMALCAGDTGFGAAKTMT